MAVIETPRAPESTLQRRLFFLAKRFVAGENAGAAMDAIAALNAAGFFASLDFLGEDVTDRAAAIDTRDEYFHLLEEIRTRGVESNVSVKLSALGLLIDEDFAVENLSAICEAARANPDPYVRIDMEGSAVLDATLRVYRRVRARHDNIGIVLQAYLKRTPEDVEQAIATQTRVRLCKGAYNESPEIAFKDMPAIRRAYLRLAEALLTRGTYPGIATHDARLIEAVKSFATERGIAKDRFEFQMLYGVRPALQRSLVAAGYRVRIYVPYGSHWAGYFYRRVMERKENALFALSSILGR
ncbi:MAG: proline dehydrogenase family protein [Candidatus Velthaea sp.]